MTRPSPQLLAAAAMLSAALTAGCGQRGASPGAARPAANLIPLAGKDDPVVATVNGAPILASDLAHQMKKGQPRDKALEELVRLELLVQEAVRRGLHRDPPALKAQRRAMAEKMMRVGFTDGYSPERIPMDMVQMAYRKYRGRYQHPELVKVSHLIAMAKKEDPPEKHAAARKIITRLRKQAAARPMTDAEFKALLDGVEVEEGGPKLRAESFTTDRVGRTVREFAEAAFAMTREGEISPVTRSIYGYHVIRLAERIPARNDPLAKVEKEVRQGIFKATRLAAFNRWAGELAKKQAIKAHPEVLEAVLGKRAAGAPAEAAGAGAR